MFLLVLPGSAKLCLCCQPPTLQSITELQSSPQQQQQQLEQQLLTSPSLKYLLQQPADSDSSPTRSAAPVLSLPGSAQKQQQQQQQEKQQKEKQQREKQQREKQQKEKQQKEKEKHKKDSGAAAVAVELGSISVALWWEPTRRSSGLGVAERVSFCLLPGEVKVGRDVLQERNCFSVKLDRIRCLLYTYFVEVAAWRGQGQSQCLAPSVKLGKILCPLCTSCVRI
jgi:hypothetical protein